MPGELYRLIIALVVTVIVVWLLGTVAALPGIIVGLVGLLVFLALFFGSGRLKL